MKTRETWGAFGVWGRLRAINDLISLSHSHFCAAFQRVRESEQSWNLSCEGEKWTNTLNECVTFHYSNLHNLQNPAGISKSPLVVSQKLHIECGTESPPHSQPNTAVHLKCVDFLYWNFNDDLVYFSLILSLVRSFVIKYDWRDQLFLFEDDIGSLKASTRHHDKKKDKISREKESH